MLSVGAGGADEGVDDDLTIARPDVWIDENVENQDFCIELALRVVDTRMA